MTVNDKLLWPIVKVLVVTKLRARLGGHVRMISVGGAAFAPQRARIFIGLGLNGDLARIRDGRISITGRVKDVIAMSNGEKVPPGDAEQAIMLDPIFEQVLVIGEGRPKLGLLCVAKSKDLHELCARANARLREFPGYVRINHIAGVDTAWSIENGLLTPTLKTRRKEIEKRYAKIIEAMYTDSSACVPKS